MKRPGFKRIHCKVIIDGKVHRHDFKAGPRSFFDADKNVDGAIEAIALALEEKFPGRDFRMVEIAPNAFNFIAVEKIAEIAVCSPPEHDRELGRGT